MKDLLNVVKFLITPKKLAIAGIIVSIFAFFNSNDFLRNVLISASYSASLLIAAIFIMGIIDFHINKIAFRIENKRERKKLEEKFLNEAMPSGLNSAMFKNSKLVKSKES